MTLKVIINTCQYIWHLNHFKDLDMKLHSFITRCTQVLGSAVHFTLKPS